MAPASDVASQPDVRIVGRATEGRRRWISVPSRDEGIGAKDDCCRNPEATAHCPGDRKVSSSCACFPIAIEGKWWSRWQKKVMNANPRGAWRAAQQIEGLSAVGSRYCERSACTWTSMLWVMRDRDGGGVKAREHMRAREGWWRSYEQRWMYFSRTHTCTHIADMQSDRERYRERQIEMDSIESDGRESECMQSSFFSTSSTTTTTATTTPGGTSTTAGICASGRWLWLAIGSECIGELLLLIRQVTV